MSDDLNKRISEYLPGIPPETIFQQRQNWQETNFLRRVLIAENERVISEAHNSLETCSPETVKELQGIIKGVRKANAVINSLGLTK